MHLRASLVFVTLVQKFLHPVLAEKGHTLLHREAYDLGIDRFGDAHEPHLVGSSGFKPRVFNVFSDALYVICHDGKFIR